MDANGNIGLTEGLNLMDIKGLVDRLSAHRTIGMAPREELTWIATHGTLRQFQHGDLVVRQTEVVDGLYILLTGRMSIWINRGARYRKVMEWEGGDVTGLLPYSRLLTPPGDTIVDEPIEAVALAREDLPELIRNCYEVTSILVHVMTDRARQFTSTDLRDEKLVSLGKLAAGLAHELNNPASAAMRDAKSMAKLLDEAEKAARAIGDAGLTVAQQAELDRVHLLCTGSPMHLQRSGLALADREEELAAWLSEHGTSVTMAEDLAKTPIERETLDRLAGSIAGSSLDTALRWIAAGYAARALAVDIERAVTRIHGLVTAVKGFTHMDKDRDVGPVELRPGLADTVALLEGKARARSVAISLDIAPDLPIVYGLIAEINQIWMNLIDNAIDAAPENGQVTVSAALEGPSVVVSVVDDGPGIPADIKRNIFDPFFTTKSVGKGTGLGLDIVRRIIDWHNGDIDVVSEPGRTEFRVSLPALPVG
jgi:signal transduction histidine kinase